MHSKYINNKCKSGKTINLSVSIRGWPIWVFLAIGGQYMMPIFFGRYIWPLSSRVIVYSRAQDGSSSSLIHSNNTAQNSSEAFCLCLLTDTNVSHRLANANWLTASRRRCWSADIMVSPVTAVIKSALSSQTLHYRKDKMKTTSSFSENGRFFSKIHSYKNPWAAFLFWNMQCSCFNEV